MASQSAPSVINTSKLEWALTNAIQPVPTADTMAVMPDTWDGPLRISMLLCTRTSQIIGTSRVSRGEPKIYHVMQIAQFSLLELQHG